MTELVVLVDGDGVPIGTRPKSTVHGASTPLHLGVSCHVLDAGGRLLVTRRSLEKQTSPGVWTNAFCGHPAPGEQLESAVRRRARDELGIDLDDVECLLPTFAYTATDAAGVEENERCPVFSARIVGRLDPDPREVVETRWTTPERLGRALDAAPWAFSPWLVQHFPSLSPLLPAGRAGDV